MKVLLINGSPRPNHNTGKALQAAKEGAEIAGAETELVNLFRIKDLKGCYSCYQCQRNGFDKSNPMCCVKDSLSPVLEKARDAEVIIIGTPVYFLYPTSETLAFLTRFLFPKLSYIREFSRDTNKPVENPKRMATIFTMNSSTEMFKQIGEEQIMSQCAASCQMLYGHCETLPIYQTTALDNFDNYQFPEPFINVQQAYHNTHFPEQLQQAFNLGKRLVEEASVS